MNADEMKRDPATFLEAEIKNYIANSPNNIMPDFPGEHMWDEPLVGFADGDDPLFTEYKRIIGDFHVTPREALEMNLKKKTIGYDHPENISVISYFLPSTKPLSVRACAKNRRFALCAGIVRAGSARNATSGYNAIS